jgi:diadenosine tetraphosphate (Ap4A) HIT family hydrolase
LPLPHGVDFNRAVPETPEELWQRVRDDLRVPPVESWDVWPFAGEPRLVGLEPPLAEEPALAGAGGVDCPRCSYPDDGYVWTNDRWRVHALGPTGLPLVVLLEPRAHHTTVGSLPDDVAADLGVQLARVDRAIRSVGDFGNVHVCRYGDGSEHLHWWFMARPTRFRQLRTSLVTLWDDILPPVPEELWRADVERLRAALGE